jgi:peptidoglycan/xylan/chitin deacetylase (PgdA/CDA1 family)
MRNLDSSIISSCYYKVKPLIPRRMQLLIRRWVAARKRQSCTHSWPIDSRAGEPPPGWRGWPDNKRFAVVMTHDVESFQGHEKCHHVMQMEEKLGFRSSFNFVAEDYRVTENLRRQLSERGFEIGVHGLTHDNRLYESLQSFRRHAVKINEYLKAWGSVGFRSPCMYHNLDWLHELHIKYDASTFDTDPFEPQPDGFRTIFPFFVKGGAERHGYVELPYTLPQDLTLFILFREKDTALWREKVDWIAQQGGMALLITHPDYMNFHGRPGYQEYPARHYEELLHYIAREYEGSYWSALPHEMADFWAKNRMEIHADGTGEGFSGQSAASHELME